MIRPIVHRHLRFGAPADRTGMRDDIVAYCIQARSCLLYTSDAADEEDSVDLGGRRIIKKY